jgi:hypothetical protein
MTKDIKRHTERRDGDRVEGEYSILDPDGTTRKVSYYVEGDSGFVAKVTRSGEAKHPPSRKKNNERPHSVESKEKPFTHFEPDIYMQQMQQYDKLHNIGFYRGLYEPVKSQYNHKQVHQQEAARQQNDFTRYNDVHQQQQFHQQNDLPRYNDAHQQQQFDQQNYLPRYNDQVQQLEGINQQNDLNIYNDIQQQQKVHQQNDLPRYNDAHQQYDSHNYQAPHHESQSYHSETRGNFYPNTATKHQPQQGKQPEGHAQYQYEHHQPQQGKQPEGHSQYQYEQNQPQQGKQPEGHSQYQYEQNQPHQGKQPEGHSQYQYDHTQYASHQFDKEKISQDVEHQIRQQIDSKDAQGGKQIFDLGDGKRQEMSIEELRSHLMSQLQQEEQKDGHPHSHAEQHQIISQHQSPQAQSDTYIHPQDYASSTKTQGQKRMGLFTPYI